MTVYFQTLDEWWAGQNQQRDWYDKGLNAEDARQYWIGNISNLAPPPSPAEPEPPMPTPIPTPEPTPMPTPIPEPVAGVSPGVFTRIIFVDGIKYMGTFSWNGIGYDCIKRDRLYRQKPPYENVTSRIYNPSELTTIISTQFGRLLQGMNGQDYYYGFPVSYLDDALGQIQRIVDLADIPGGLPTGIQPWGSPGMGWRDCDDYSQFCMAMVRLAWPGAAICEVFGTAYNQVSAGHAWNLFVDDEQKVYEIDLTQVIGPPSPRPVNPTNSVTWFRF